MIAVAGPERSGSGNGVPVPSMTSLVGFGAVRASDLSSVIRLLISLLSIRAQVHRLDDARPTCGVRADPGVGLGRRAADGLEIVRAQALTDLRCFEGLPSLSFQQS